MDCLEKQLYGFKNNTNNTYKKSHLHPYYRAGGIKRSKHPNK
jgi:hypothetical protein